MYRGLWKLFSFNGAIGRWEYFKVTWGLGLIPLLCILRTISIVPENRHLFIMVGSITGVILLLYLWICLACMFKRLYHIFSNKYFIIFLFFLTYFGVIFVACPIAEVYFSAETVIVIRKLSTWLLCMFLIFMPGRGESDKLIPGWLFFISFILSLSIIWTGFYYNITSRVMGEGMLPSLKPRDRIYIDVLNKDFERGDIIVFNSVYKQKNIKRIIGLPGDEVKIEENKVYINGNKLEESYINPSNQPINCSDNLVCGPITVPESNYYVLGDNRSLSHDSRYYGFVNKEEIFGKVLHIFYPKGRRNSL